MSPGGPASIKTMLPRRRLVQSTATGKMITIEPHQLQNGQLVMPTQQHQQQQPPNNRSMIIGKFALLPNNRQQQQMKAVGGTIATFVAPNGKAMVAAAAAARKRIPNGPAPVGVQTAAKKIRTVGPLAAMQTVHLKQQSMPMQSSTVPLVSGGGGGSQSPIKLQQQQQRVHHLATAPSMSMATAAVMPMDSAAAAAAAIADETDTIEKRNLHNNMERQRRIGLKNLFDELKDQLPSLKEKERAPKVTILREAALLCARLHQEDLERTRLKRQQEALYQRVSVLRTQLAAQRSGR